MTTDNHQEVQKPQIVITFAGPESAIASFEFKNVIPGIIAAQMAVVAAYLTTLAQEQWKQDLAAKMTNKGIVVPGFNLRRSS